MKTLSASMQTHLQQEATSLASCWRITRTDGTEFYFTDHDTDIVFESNTYKAESGYQRSAIANDSTLSVDNLDLEGILFDSVDITEQDLRAGLFNGATIRIFLVNWQDTSAGDIKLRRGTLGEVRLTEQGTFQAELRGMTQPLAQTTGEVVQAECQADLGDSRCQVPILPSLRADSTAYVLGDFIRVVTDGGVTGQAQYENRIYECTTAGTSSASAPTFSTTVDSTTTDGTAVFTARQAWTRHAVVDTVTDGKNFTLTVAFDESRAVDDWFNGGALVFESGNNSGLIGEIRDWVQTTRTLTLFLPTSFTVSPGDLVRLYPGCDKRDVTCQGKFIIPNSMDFPSGTGNIENFRGFPFVPGSDELTRYPDAQT